MSLFIVSGTSGAGKSIVLHTLEDMGYHCIDNLPVNLLPAFAAELVQSNKGESGKAAVGIDARNLSDDLSALPQTLTSLKEGGVDCQIIFLDADDTVLIQRFSETRRRHPLTAAELPLHDAIERERNLLKPISSRANMLVDTSHTNVHQLRNLIKERLGDSDPKVAMSILFESFGFKHGIPMEADYVFDVRCLPNPHWEPQLRVHSGREPEVIRFLETHEEVHRMFQQISDFLESWVPRFRSSNRSYMTVAIGCTGGHHRSVYLVERLARHFRQSHPNVMVRHRDLN